MFRFLFLLLPLLSLFGEQRAQFLGGAGRIVISPDLPEPDLAFSFLAEGAEKNYRANATIGIAVDCHHWFKTGAEFLVQDLKYRFDSGRTHRWVQQSAVGLEYAYVIDEDYWFHALNLSAYGTHSPTHHLHYKVFGDERLYRRVSGSWAWGGLAGFTLKPWCGADIFAGASFDKVLYNNRFIHNTQYLGAGGILRFNQEFFQFGISAEGRWLKTYRSVEAKVCWASTYSCGIWGLGVFANATQGRHGLPSSYMVGVELATAFDFKRRCDCDSEPVKAFQLWGMRPAVYLPEVLAIRSQIYGPVPLPQ